MLSEAKRNKEQHISEAVDKAVNDKVQEIQVKLENLIVEKKKVAEIMKNSLEAKMCGVRH